MPGYIMVIEIQSGHCIRRSGLFGFLFQLAGFAIAVKLHNAIAFRVTDRISKNRGAAFALAGALENEAEILAIKNVVAQHQRATIITDEIAANQKSLGQPSRSGLHGIADLHAPLFS